MTPADEPTAPVVVAPVPADAEDPGRFTGAIDAIDHANSLDPTRMSLRGVAFPKELLHSRLMTAWLLRLDPGAGELAHLAARAHHFRRWTRPRSDYPEGRSGYLRWRAAAKRAHAEEVGRLLLANGYEEPQVERVGSIIRKEGLGIDPVVQTHEDGVCLVFLQTQLLDVADRVGDDPMVGILVRTIPKLSPRGMAAAMSLDLGGRGADLLERATAAARNRPGP